MNHPLQLVQGKTYRVIRPFTDYDRMLHPIGETWVFNGTRFLPYEDGLTLHVLQDGQNRVYRLQWRAGEQAALIDHFRDYVVETGPS